MPVVTTETPNRICQGYSAIIGEVFYVCILKNVWLDSKFEGTDHIKRNSDSFRNRWETLKYFCTKKLICGTWNEYCFISINKMLSNTLYWLLVEQRADLNIYANLKCGGFFLKAVITVKELSKCEMEFPFG